MTKLAIVLCLLAVSALHDTEAKTLTELFDSAVGSACATFSGVASVPTCTVQFHSDLSMPSHKIVTSNDEVDQDLEQVRGTWKYCCAVAALKSCILTKIKDSCGDKAEGQSSSLVRNVIGLNQDTCNGDEIIYQSASPLCWPEPAQYVAVICLALLIVSCFCCCICRICRK